MINKNKPNQTQINLKIIKKMITFCISFQKVENNYINSLNYCNKMEKW